MTTLQLRQQKKNEALNSIRKIYNPKYKFPYDRYSDESCSEQKEQEIRYIIEKLEKELSLLKCDVP
jgi:hypothetical protein